MAYRGALAQSSRTITAEPSLIDTMDGTVKKKKKVTEEVQLRKHWDKILKRSDNLRNSVGLMTPNMSSNSMLPNNFKRNQSQ